MAPSAVGSRPATGQAAEEALRHYVQGRILDEEGESAEALNEYFRALTLDPHALTVARSISELSARRGETARSLEFAQRALAIDPQDARSLWLQGTAQFGLGQPEDALRSLEAAANRDSDQVEYVRTLGRVAEEVDRVDVVARAFRRAVELDEEDGESWFQLAAAEARLGRFGAADTALTEAIELNPDRPGALFLRGWIQESLGHPERAVELYRAHLAAHPDDDVTRRRLVGMLGQRGQFADAYAEAQKVSHTHPRDLDALEVEADLALQTGHASEALRVLERMRQQHPSDAAVVERTVGVLARHGRAADGLAVARAWSKSHPADPRGAELEARAEVGAGHLELALARARDAVAMAPDSIGPRVLLGRLFQGARRFASAESVWVDADRRYPKRSGIQLDLAYCREQTGNLKGAESAVRDVLAREPRNPTALNFLGYLFADHNYNLVEAETLIQRALQQDPDNGAYLDSLGWVFYRMGRFGDARVRLEQAVRLSDGDPVVREHLGDVYKEMKLMELARDQYRLSLASDSSNARVRGKLEGIR